MSSREVAESYARQVADQNGQVEHLKGALRQLDAKLAEARARSELLIAQHRRARALRRTTGARGAATGRSGDAAFRRAQDKVLHAEVLGRAEADLGGDDVEHRLAALARQDRVERLLADLKARRGTT